MTATQSRADTCLQCGKTRAEVRDPYDWPCATATGYEVVETLDEWDRHHWRDWSDKELENAGILPEFFDEHRRDNVYELPYAPCDHHVRGHNFPSENVYFGEFLVEAKGQCRDCGKRRGAS